jgi:uncharacterized damage-inducible protein DinB
MTDVDTDALRAVVRQILHEGHAALRDVVSGLEAAALDWCPGEDTNSIAALTAHALDAERFLVSTAAGVDVERDRDAQFRVRVNGPAELVALVDRLEREVDGYLELVTAERLTLRIERPGRVHEGAWWLLHAIEHTREHVGQATLTRQLYEQRNAGSPA